MDIFKIKAILATIEMKSLSRAAESLSYSPSAFSYLLSSAEKELGVEIFNRNSKGMELNENGKKLYPIFLELAENEKKLFETAEKLANKRKNVIRIATLSSVLHGFLSFIIMDFQTLHPEINIIISTVVNPELSEKTDIVFTSCFDTKSVRDTFTPLFEDPFYLVCKKDSFEAKSYSKDEIYKIPYVISNVDLDAYFDFDKFEKTIYFDSDNGLSIIEMIRAGFGASLLPWLHIKNLTKELDIFTIEPGFSRIIGYDYNTEKASNELELLLKYLKEKSPTFK